MFGGLEIKGASAPANEKKDQTEASSGTSGTSIATSGFSFLSSAQSDPEPTPAAAPASAPTTSGFSFMSSVAETPNDTVKDETPPASSVTATATAKTTSTSSGFSFLSDPNPVGETNQDKKTAVQEEEDVQMFDSVPWLLQRFALIIMAIPYCVK